MTREVPVRGFATKLTTNNTLSRIQNKKGRRRCSLGTILAFSKPISTTPLKNKKSKQNANFS